MRRIFWGDKGEGSIQNVETYGIEVPAKTNRRSLPSPKAEKFDFLRFWGFWVFLGGFAGFRGNFWGIKGVESIQNKGN